MIILSHGLYERVTPLMMLVAMTAEAVSPLEPTYQSSNSQPPAAPGHESRDRGWHDSIYNAS